MSITTELENGVLDLLSELLDLVPLEHPKEFNIIPVPLNTKIPIFKWQNYQKKKYEKPIKKNSNYAVICGEISNNLLILDIDFKDKKHFKEIYNAFKLAHPDIVDTRIVQTPHGFHFYYYMKGFSVNRKTNKNAGYNNKNKFKGALKTKYKNYLKGFDILGNNGYAITWNSQINSDRYKCVNQKPIRHITESEFNQIKDFFLLKKPIRARKFLYDILNGKLDIDEAVDKTEDRDDDEDGKPELLFWKALYREAYHYLGLSPQELFKGLEANQPSFDLEETETQLQYSYHSFTDKPFTNEKLKEMFPDYQFGKPDSFSKKDSNKISEKKKIKPINDSKEVKEFATNFLTLSGREKLKRIDNIIAFDITGEENTRRLLFFLLLSNWCKRLKTIVIIRGTYSAGKNHIVLGSVNLFPERDIEVFSSATASVFNYEDLSNKKLLFLREMRDNENTEEIFKSIYDGARKHKEVVRVDGQNVVIDHLLASLGIITTLSFETLQQDLISRSWVLTIDESITQTQKITRFKNINRRNLIERNIQKKKIDKEAHLISEAWKYLEWDYYVQIPYIEKLEALFPKNPNINLRRDDDKLYNLIEIITLFNQRNRKSLIIGDFKYLFAEYEDLEIALEIAQDLYINLILHIDPLKREILEAFTEANKVWTITKMFELLRKKVGCRDTIGNKLFDLTTDGFLDKKQKKNREWHFKKLKGIDYKEALQIDNIKEEIDDLVEEKYNYYSEQIKL